jgi:ubiquinone/menaquinone biosynthesis C-methylase UbiE
MMHDFPSNLQYQEHLKRYNFAKKYVERKIVLDIGCGPRSGSFYLAEKAKRIIAIDASKESIEYAKSHFQKENLEYQVMSGTDLKFSDNSFDVVVSLEVLEHIGNYRKYLSEILRVLKSGGIYVLSTPNIKMSRNPNPAHIKEFSLRELESLLNEYFVNIDLYGQFRGKGVFGISKEIMFFVRKFDVFNLRRIFSRRFKGEVSEFIAKKTGAKEDKKVSLDDIELVKGRIQGAEYFIGICRKI